MKQLNNPDPEVQAQKTRRRFTDKYKLQILAEADTCSQQGEIGALLRREGLYSSHCDARIYSVIARSGSDEAIFKTRSTSPLMRATGFPVIARSVSDEAISGNHPAIASGSEA